MSSQPWQLEQLEALEVDTAVGPGRIRFRREPADRGLLLLGHGAGGRVGVDTVDVQAAARAGLAAGWTVGLVEQPWRLAGRRVAPSAHILDEAWTTVVRGVRRPGAALSGCPGPFILGGRSAGARVACRTAPALGADGVLALSFPLHPPGKPDRLRVEDLRRALDAGIPIAAVQGRADPFGGADELSRHLPEVYPVTGTHSFRPSAFAEVAEAVSAILTSFHVAGRWNEPR